MFFVILITGTKRFGSGGTNVNGTDLKGLEILAPAGSGESLEAAVRSGADAVYFGASDFNARRNAENFTDADFLEAVEYCRIHGVKSYITLNTVFFDREKDALKKTLRLIAESGADAVIVQDLGVAAAVKRYCPSLTLHASTQTAVHNVSGAEELIKLGFKRIVLARENSYEEIKKICRETGAETEIFIHGAHCMSVSGMCYMSSFFGGRSGNRGLCAQPCRLNFKANGRDYALSLKDMSLINHLEEIAEAGVRSLKIEGRMKRPEYVAAAVDAVKTRKAGGAADEAVLRSVFSRSGFTDGYFTGHRTLEMFGNRTKDDVVSASSVLPSLRRLYKNERSDIPVGLRFEMTDKTSLLTLSDGKNTVKINGDVPQRAEKASLTEETAFRSLSKFGGTPYYLSEAEYFLADGFTLPMSSLNKMRRNAADELSLKRAKTDGHPFYNDKNEKKAARRDIFGSPSIHLRFERFEQIFDISVCDRIILPLTEIIKHSEKIKELSTPLAVEIPPLVYPADEKKTEDGLLLCRRLGIEYALCENIGSLSLAKKAGLKPTGGHMLNILNSLAAEEYEKDGLTEITLSAEMSFGAMREFVSEKPFGYIGYGHMPLMRFRCCPMQTKNGCGDCNGSREITDRRGDKMTVLCSERKFSTLYNPVPLYTGNMKTAPSDFVTLYFTNETPERCKAVTELFLSHAAAPFAKTSGLYDKELL